MLLIHFAITANPAAESPAAANQGREFLDR
jgi:hypothetical protein